MGDIRYMISEASKRVRGKITYITVLGGRIRFAC